jgi:GTPase SAR1 family protein
MGMIEAQKKVIEVCEKVLAKAKETSVNETVCGKLAALAENAREQQLVIPIVGAFSSGKSSLINSLLGKNVLPVAITPETSLATELHYSPQEFIEAVKEDGTSTRYSIEEITDLTRNAKNYSYARLYLNNSHLQNIEPLVLVDMPGFDSPLDAHNKAIMTYLSRGCHYIALSSVEEGTVTASLSRRLREIDGLGRGFSFFISKTDLKPKETVNEMVSHFQKILSDSFDMKNPVKPVNANSSDEVMSVLKNLNADSIFLGLYREPCADTCGDVINNLSTQISASARDAAKIQEAIKELRGSLDKLRQKAETETENMQRKYSGGIIGGIVNDVGIALESASDELVSVALSGNQEETNRRLNEIVRSALTVSINNKLGEVNHNIVTDFSQSLQGLDKVMKEMDISQDYVNELAGKIQSAFELFQGTEDGKNVAGNAGSKSGTGLNIGYKSVAGIGLAAFAVNPIIGALVMFLPEIIGAFMKLFGGGGNQQQNQREAVRAKLSGEVFPQIKRKIRDELPSQLNEQIQKMIDQVRKQFEEKITLQQADIEKSVEQKNADIQAAEAKRASLEAARTEVQAITNSILEWA